jgi:hypothetical protein
MCDRYSHKYGYICWECFEELVARGEGTSIIEFMATPREEDGPTKEDAYEYYDRIFPDGRST